MNIFSKCIIVILAGALSYVTYWSLGILTELWSSAPADIPHWFATFIEVGPWVLFVGLVVMIIRL